MGSIGKVDTPEFGLEDVAKLAQKCLQSHPVVILGSGASVPHQIRGMEALASDLGDGIVPQGADEEDAWTLVKTALANGDGLEKALQKTAAPDTLVQKIVNLTWSVMAGDEISVLVRAACGAENFPL